MRGGQLEPSYPKYKHWRVKIGPSDTNSMAIQTTLNIILIWRNMKKDIAMSLLFDGNVGGKQMKYYWSLDPAPQGADEAQHPGLHELCLYHCKPNIVTVSVGN